MSFFSFEAIWFWNHQVQKFKYLLGISYKRTYQARFFVTDGLLCTILGFSNNKIKVLIQIKFVKKCFNSNLDSIASKKGVYPKATRMKSSTWNRRPLKMISRAMKTLKLRITKYSASSDSSHFLGQKKTGEKSSEMWHIGNVNDFMRAVFSSRGSNLLIH